MAGKRQELDRAELEDDTGRLKQCLSSSEKRSDCVGEGFMGMGIPVLGVSGRLLSLFIFGKDVAEIKYTVSYRGIRLVY